MKKAIGAVTLILVLAAAGSAFAYGGGRGRGMENPTMAGNNGVYGGPGMMRGMGGQGMAGGGMMGDNAVYGGPGMMRGMGGRGMAGQRMMDGRACAGLPQASVEVPQEIRDKQAEMKKMRIDMQNEISRKPIDRSKIETLHRKRSELRNELSTWFLKQRLDAIEKLQK